YKPAPSYASPKRGQTKRRSRAQRAMPVSCYYVALAPVCGNQRCSNTLRAVIARSRRPEGWTANRAVGTSACGNLWDKKNFIGPGIFHLRARWEATYIDVSSFFVERTEDVSRFIWNRFTCRKGRLRRGTVRCAPVRR